MTDYVGAAMAKPGDLLQYGRKGMKWGQRIFTSGSKSSDGESKGESKSSAKKESSDSATKAPAKTQSGPETSSQRYARIQAEVTSGRAKEMTSDDLKFFNARTEALAKVNKLNEQKPSWIRETTTTVIQSAAQRQMQMVANTLADKYVGDPIKQAINATRDKLDDD